MHRVLSFFRQLSNTAKARLGIGIAVAIAIGIMILGVNVFTTMSDHTPIHPPTAGEEYAAILLINEAAMYPDEAIKVVEIPGEPTRYYLLRDFVTEQQHNSDLVALQPPYEEADQ